MTAASESSNEKPLEPKQQSLLKSSVVMASGTLVSRLLGFVRTALLLVAIGTYGGVADAFSAANTLPNTIYNLLAAGVFDAVLIPQIVRALKRKSGSIYLNRLLTLAGTILFGITVITMVAAPLLVTIMGNAFTGETRTLAIIFALWCLPQIFFYGLYNLLGEVLNARGIFGPYMWAPVVNNIISIAGLVFFIVTWGPAGDLFPSDQFSQPQLYVLAGSATLGVILQALVLVIPVAKSGVKLRLDFHFKGTDFGSASKVAGWTFATLMISQLGVISTTNLAVAAGNWGEVNNIAVASLPAYNTAFMMYMVPQSLIAVTLATAIFTRLANNVADGDYRSVAYNYHLGVRLITMLSMLAAAILISSSVPVMQLILFGKSPEMASLYGDVLVALVLGVPSTGIVLISQRVFFAFENAKPVFLMGIVPTALQLMVGWGIFFLAGAEWWTVGAALGETVCRVIQGFIAVFWTAHLVRTINAGRIISSYLLYLFAFIASALVGWGLLHFISPISYVDSSVLRWFDALWRLALVAVVVTVVYFAILRKIDRRGTAMLANMLRDRLPARFRKPNAETVAALDAESRQMSAGAGVVSQDDGLAQYEALTNQMALGNVSDEESLLDEANGHTQESSSKDAESKATSTSESDQPVSPLVPPSQSDSYSHEEFGIGEVGADSEDKNWNPEPPAWEDIIAGEEASRSLSRAFDTHTSLNTGPIPIVSSLQRTSRPPFPVVPGNNITGPGIPDLDESAKMDIPSTPHEDHFNGRVDNSDIRTDPDSTVAGATNTGQVPTPAAGTGRKLFGAQLRQGTQDGSGLLPGLKKKGRTEGKNGMGIPKATQTGNSGSAGKGSSGGKSTGAGGAGAGAGSGAGSSGAGSKKRFDPTIPAMIIAAIIVIVGVVYAFTTLRSSGPDISLPIGQSEEQSVDTPATEAPPTEAPAEAVPVISGVSIFSWNDDDADHPELASTLTDGDPNSYWYTRYYYWNEFDESTMISLLVNLEQEALVSEITLDVTGSGGEVTVRAAEDGNPRVGTILATSTLDGQTVIKLPQPTKLSQIGINFVTLPTDDEGLQRAKVSGISIK